MSDNPFASGSSGSQYPQPTAPTSRKKPPGGLTAILVICLVLGIIGLVGSCFAGIGFAFSSFAEKMAIEGAVDEAQRELQKSNFAAQKTLMIPGLALSGLNLIVATMLITGSILGLQRKETGRKILGFALLAAIFYSLFKIAFYIYQQIVSAAAMREVMEKMQGQPGAEQMATLTSISTSVAWGMAIFFVIISLAMLGFYIWAKLYLGKPKVVEHFASQAS